MNPSGPWVERLGWTLLHFLWQGAAIAILYAAARRAVSTSSRRYLLACAALASMMAAPLLTWVALRPAELLPSATPLTAAAPAASPAFTTLPASIGVVPAAAPPAQFLPWVVTVWLAGALVFWVRLAGGWAVAARMRSTLVRPAPPEWQATLRDLAARIGLSRPVRLLVSALVQVPTVVGCLRPVVLVPVGALAGLPAGQLEALLLHELAHIRRHDYLVNILQSAAEALLFYHPVVWWVSGHIRVERELCCDDVAVAASGDALTYARALAVFESSRPAHLHAALAATGGSLSHRIGRLLGIPRPAAGRTALGPGAAAVAVLLAAAAYGLLAQPGAHPAFQSVSIRRNTSDWSARFRHPMSMRANASLLLLIQFAYAPHDSSHQLPLPASQIVGGPAWINSEGYDIEVKAPANTDPKQEWQMWQTLLADRFQLKLHRETRQLPLYVLTAAKNGPKLPAPPKDLGCVSLPPGTAPHPVPGKVDCGYVSGPYPGNEAGLLHIQGRKVHMQDLIRELALVLDRPIVDKTGFTAEFDLALNFTPDDALRGFPAYQPASNRLPTDPKLPNILTALEQQLGLSLAPATGPVEVLVVDRAERPVTN